MAFGCGLVSTMTVQQVLKRLEASGYEVELIGRSGGGATGFAFDVMTPGGRRVVGYRSSESP